MVGASGRRGTLLSIQCCMYTCACADAKPLNSTETAGLCNCAERLLSELYPPAEELQSFLVQHSGLHTEVWCAGQWPSVDAQVSCSLGGAFYSPLRNPRLPKI